MNLFESVRAVTWQGSRLEDMPSRFDCPTDLFANFVKKLAKLLTLLVFIDCVMLDLGGRHRRFVFLFTSAELNYLHLLTVSVYTCLYAADTPAQCC